MTQQRPLRFGIPGAGMIVGDEDDSLLDPTTLGDRVEIITIAGVVPGHAQCITQRSGIDTVYESLDEMLRDDRVEVMADLTPTSMHAGTFIRTPHNGRHLLSEKLLATTPEEANALIEEVER